MLRPRIKITVTTDSGTLIFDFVNSCVIDSSWETLTDTATIILPNRLKLNDEVIANNTIGKTRLFKRGDAVLIEMAYFPNALNEVFQGFISDIIPESPMTIKCEDSAWLIKQKSNPPSYYKSVTLTKLLADFLTGTVPFKSVTTTNLGKLKIDRVPFARVLMHLKSKFGFLSWFRKGTLYVGLRTIEAEAVTHKFERQFNIISDNLTWREKNDFDFSIKGLTISLDNVQQTVYGFYDENGDVAFSTEPQAGTSSRTLVRIGMNLNDLKNALKEELQLTSYTGWKGSINVFGTPLVKHGDRVEIVDKRFSEKSGTYLVKSVRTSFSFSNGFKQTVELAHKESETVLQTDIE